MCGISGLFNLTEIHADFPAVHDIEKMVASLKHRGPDHTGIFVDRRIALGAARLAIIDLSSAARQPMIIGEGDYVISLSASPYPFTPPRVSPRMNWRWTRRTMTMTGRVTRVDAA